MKINVGDYVRTPNGVIAKIIDIKDDEGQYFINNNAVSLSSKTYISDKNITIGENFKHSPNIIDLIEVGDYVNGYKVYYCYCADEDSTGLFIDTEKGREWLDYSGQINSIVTKEQFEAMKYVVKED